MQLSHCGSSHIAPPSYVPPHLRVPFSSWIRGSFIPHRQGTEAISPISVSGHVTRPTLPQTEPSSLGQPSGFTREGITCSYSVCVCMTAASHPNIEKINSRRYWHYQNICDYNSAYKPYLVYTQSPKCCRAGKVLTMSFSGHYGKGYLLVDICNFFQCLF